MLDDFPKTHGPEREAKILECVHNGRAKYRFVSITSESKGHKAEFLVFEDALQIDNVRINANATTQQHIADLLRCILPTAKIYDLMWHQCLNRINPHPRSITSTTQAMIDHSQDIDKALSKLDFMPGLKSTVGKTWIIDNALLQQPGKACNYGYHFDTGYVYKGIKGNICASMLKNPKTGLYWHMIQSRGFHHNSLHTDYSQVVILVSRQCWIDGKEMDIHDVLKDPELASLACHDGVLKILRQPHVQELDPIVDLPIKSEPVIPIPEKLVEPIINFPDNAIVVNTTTPETKDQQLSTSVVRVSNQNNNIWYLITNVFKLIPAWLSWRK